MAQVLDMADPNFGEQLADAIGAKPGDTIALRGPQFDRTDGKSVSAPDVSLFEELRQLPKEKLIELGLQPWGDYGLWLFPGEWYSAIPAGHEVMCINGERSQWGENHDDDTRFGALAYGVVPDFEKGDV